MTGYQLWVLVAVACKLHLSPDKSLKTISNVALKKVEDFKYLGSWVKADTDFKVRMESTQPDEKCVVLKTKPISEGQTFPGYSGVSTDVWL